MIRGSQIRGFNIPKSLEVLKATLFADDTTVYLAEEDDFGILQRVLDTWCSAAKAKFNLRKTEIIPIGTKEYRKRVIDTYKETGAWGNYPAGVHLAEEGEAVRILGAYFGNEAEQSKIWDPKIKKMEGVLERWSLSPSTVIGKRHTTQMMVGGMSQFLANVQRMPATVTKKLMKMIRSHIWDGKKHVPVAMEHLYLPVEEGGLGVLDVEARNEAIDVMWLKLYLSSGSERPLWAYAQKECSTADSAWKYPGTARNWWRSRQTERATEMES
ncbi:uncharacterized protein TRAVEDRAFT_40509 [Trametes versicolor FP-101664 SS1]|uniref:uncharacterized protein n=1 Tax=Trametes versicolor (strain FP-101664) TaxID=717944 RepID=UPI0004621BC1|nr:uncharacterized protein TRAVEDRAFT_40509 [Trametes versicolor FP-101664 SS1]EIW52959.1 hypothetical protein TRAVEDRAFT_40509 [Trametes versicolor FP-101664 SS1]